MTDLVTAMLARKHRLLHARDQLDYQITSLCTAIDALQLTETTPEAPHPEVQQPEVATAPPAAPFTEKAALTPEAPPPQPEATVQQVPPAAPKPYVTRPAAATTGKKPTPAKSAAAAQPISYHDLIARAAEWGITEINPDALLAAVNAKAVRIGHKPYALQSRSP